MVDFTIETEIARPPGEVFAFVTDPAKLAVWQTNGQPVGAMRLAEPILKLTFKRNFGRFCATLKRVLEDTPPSS